LIWQKPPSTDATYTAGFTGSIIVEGSRYTPPAQGAAALEINNWELLLGRNVLTDPVTVSATLDQRNRFTLTGSLTNGTSLRLDRGTGLLAGRFKPDGGASVVFKGVLLPRQRVGRGVVSFADRSGPFTLNPQPEP
jgi:hypothetical protein